MLLETTIYYQSFDMAQKHVCAVSTAPSSNQVHLPSLPELCAGQCIWTREPRQA